MKKINIIFLLIITISFFAGGIKLQAQDFIDFNGWEFLSWKTDKKNVEKILIDKNIELAKTQESYTWFKYQEMDTWLYYDNNNQLNKIQQRNRFSIVEYEKSKLFFEKTKAKFIKTYGKPNHQEINKQDSVTTLIWQLKQTKIVLEYDYMYKIIDELGAGSYWIEVNISPNKFESEFVNPEKESIEQNIIGTWKLNEKKLQVGRMDAPKEKNSLEFYENGTYKRFIWSFESGGTYSISGDTLWLNENWKIGDKEGSERGKYLLQIEKFEKNKLIISFTECDVKVHQVYQKVKSSTNIIKTGMLFEKADDLLIKYGAEKNVFSRKFANPSMSYLISDKTELIGLIIIYEQKNDENIITELLQCNNPKVAKDIRVWENINEIKLKENNKTIKGLYANEYGEVRLIRQNDTIMRTIFKNNDGDVFDTLMRINYNFKLKQRQTTLRFLQLNWGGLELQEECLYIREYSNFQYLAQFIQIKDMYTRAFYKINEKVTITGEVRFGKGGGTINGIYLINYRKKADKYLSIEGLIKKEKYPIAYYSTEESPQGMFSDTNIVHYRLFMEDYEIKELPKQIFKGTTINNNEQAAFIWEFADSEIYFFDNKKPWEESELNKKIKIEAVLIQDAVGKSILKNWKIKK
ncbi:MAG: hypothetical protein U9N51_10915 [Bacteroidota bacterium]|nr:hypothetical protein [Bacteroidota bacterium]